MNPSHLQRKGQRNSTLIASNTTTHAPILDYCLLLLLLLKLLPMYGLCGSEV
ncbi:hypothetical protein CIPAW_02G056900 [Carya illinoinensis]|uniref:Uncharacterized protein n=1 Tax=Carya illinoinensis TaxID=32201 RepID=A0A8T1RBC9_CARIL|nr:hypothetical protein CIPAW_02G056900 [Carya illinoinensis]